MKKNKKFAAVALLLILALILTLVNIFASPSPKPNPYPDEYKDICVHEAYAIITYQSSYRNVTILDVRTQDEYNEMHIENAILIPYDELEYNLSQPNCPLAGFENETIIVYCRSGYRSRIASNILVNHGFTKVYNMVGGILAWINSSGNYPVVSPPSENLLLNPSVEDGDGWPYYWKRYKYADVTGQHVWCPVAHTGSKSLVIKIQPNPDAPQWHSIIWYQRYYLNDSSCPFKREGTYRYRAWYQTDNASIRIYVYIRGISYGYPLIYMLVRSATPSTWEQSDWLEFTIPVDAQYIDIGMGIQLRDIDLGASQALGRADDFEVQEVT